jgi:hypothetical protein
LACSSIYNYTLRFSLEEAEDQLETLLLEKDEEDEEEEGELEV